MDDPGQARQTDGDRERHRHGRRRRILVSAVAIVAVLVSACGADQNQQATDSTPDEVGTSATEPERDAVADTPADEDGQAAGEMFVSDDTTDEGCPFDGNRVTVRPACLDAEWPLTVEEAEVYCSDPSAVLLRVSSGQPGGGVYALNGMASSQFPDLPELENVWLENPEIEGTRVSIGPLIDIGLELCDE